MILLTKQSTNKTKNCHHNNKEELQLNNTFTIGSKMRIQLKTWGRVLELKNRKSTLTETDWIRKITEFMEELSPKKCFVKTLWKKGLFMFVFVTGWQCFSRCYCFIHNIVLGTENTVRTKNGIGGKINGVLLAEKLTNTKILRSRQEGGRIRPFVVPFFATNIEEAYEKLGSMFICNCKESLSVLHHYRRKAFATCTTCQEKKGQSMAMRYLWTQ